MPQWSRDRTSYPDERWHATCSRRHAPLLLRYDHHVVRLDGRAALLRTYEWNATSPDAWPDELPFHVSFTYARGHPPAPAEVQAIVDSLEFFPPADGR